jgi:hypothetical protein
MGLDMYLSKRTYVGNEWRKKQGQQLVKVVVPENQEDVISSIPQDGIKDERISEIVENVGYWRKANAIHKWFVENCQNGEDDCRLAYVSREKLQELLDICRTVKAASKLVNGKIKNGAVLKNGEWKPVIEDGKYIEDPSVAKELLPTQEGFFFGSTEYDQYYLQDIEDTIEILDKVLSEPGSGEFYYQSSW